MFNWNEWNLLGALMLLVLFRLKFRNNSGVMSWTNPGSKTSWCVWMMMMREREREREREWGDLMMIVLLPNWEYFYLILNIHCCNCLFFWLAFNCENFEQETRIERDKGKPVESNNHLFNVLFGRRHVQRADNSFSPWESYFPLFAPISPLFNMMVGFFFSLFFCLGFTCSRLVECRTRTDFLAFIPLGLGLCFTPLLFCADFSTFFRGKSKVFNKMRSGYFKFRSA